MEIADKETWSTKGLQITKSYSSGRYTYCIYISAYQGGEEPLFEANSFHEINEKGYKYFGKKNWKDWVLNFYDAFCDQTNSIFSMFLRFGDRETETFFSMICELKHDLETNPIESNNPYGNSESVNKAIQTYTENVSKKETEKEVLEETKANFATSNSDSIHPTHYMLPNGLQVFDIQKVVCEDIPDAYASHCISDALKYLLRAGRKDKQKTAEDIKKAVVYLNEAVKSLEENT